MTRRFARSARALSVLTLAATAALSTAQSAPSTQPATQPATAPATEASTLPTTLPATTQAVATTTPTTMPATTQAVATTGPATRSTAVGPPVSQPATRIGFQFDKTPVKQVLEYLSQKAGFSIDEEAAVEGDISIINRSEVTSAEAVTMLNAALKRKGFAAIQQGTKLRIVKWGDAKKQNIPVRYGADPEMVPDTDELVTWVIPVKNVDAAKLRTDLALLISSDADFTSNQGSNSLIMTDTCSSIRRIVAIVAKLDQQPALSSSILTRRLSFANASAAAKLVMAIFGPDQNESAQRGPGGGGPGRFFRAMMQQQGGGPGGQAGQDSGKTSGKLTAAADDRTNTIVITGPPDTLRVIDGILTTLDSDPVELSKVEVFSLEFADATSAAKLINTLFQPEQTVGGGGGGGGRGGGGGDGGGGRVPAFEGITAEDRNVKVNAAAADRTNTLVVTAPPGTMKLITQILKALDADPAARSEVKVFQLKYADSASAAKLISTIFQGDPSQQQQQQGPGGGAAGTHLPAIGALSTSLHGGRVNAVSDDRTNTLVVTAPSDAMLIVTGILEKLDSNPSAESALFIYHLRNGVAADIQATLSALFSTGTTGGGSTSSSSNTNRNSGQSLQSSGFGSSSGLGSSGRSGVGGGSSGSSGGFGSPLTSATNTQRPTGTSGGGSASSGTSIRATSELIGQVIVVADNDTNSLLVSTANRYKEQVQKIIAELDRPVPQVLIKVLIAEVTHDRSDDAGIDFSVLNTRPSGKGWQLGQQLGNAAAGTANGGLVVSLMESNLNATLHALSTEGKLDVLSRPYILASDNQPAAITIGQEVPFITNTQITETGQQINTITYQAVGIILNVTPHINPDGAVTLDVAPEISAISATTVPIGNGINAPVIDNRSAQSRVTIRNGNTIVIGGMMQDQKTTTITKIPLLGDIPYIGAFFTRYQNDRSKTELLIFLTPHLAQQPETLKGMSEAEMKGTKITPVDPATFEGHINGLHLGATTQGATSQPSIIEIHPTPSTQPFNGTIIAPASPYKNRTPIGP